MASVEPAEAQGNAAQAWSVSLNEFDGNARLLLYESAEALASDEAFLAGEASAGEVIELVHTAALLYPLDFPTGAAAPLSTWFERLPITDEEVAQLQEQLAAQGS